MNARTTVRIGGWIVSAVLLAGVPASAEDLGLIQVVKNRAGTEVVRALIEQGANVDTTQGDGTTALAWAAHWNDLETADLLVRAGANPSLANDYGVTPLTLACQNRSAAMVATLLKAGADPNVVQWTGETPLITCARTGDVQAVKLLLSAGADVDVTEERQGHTALMRAVAGKHSPVVQALIEAGADVNARSKDGFTALMFSAQEGDLESARILLGAGVDVNELTARGPDARRDLTGGPCVNNYGDSRRGWPGEGPFCFVPDANPSALVMATANGHQELALFLLDKGADPNSTDAYGWTALHHAVPEGWVAIGQTLTGGHHKPRPERRPNMPELVEALLSHGANPNARITGHFSPLSQFTNQTSNNSPIGGTPFALAAAAADVRIMRALLDAGADPHLKLELDGTPPLMLAAGAKRLADGVPREDLHGSKEAEDANSLEAVKLLVGLGADLAERDSDGRTALHAAVNIRAHEIVRFLVENGSDLDAADRRGVTPYQVAERLAPANNKYEDTMALLVKLGATVPDHQEGSNSERQ